MNDYKTYTKATLVVAFSLWLEPKSSPVERMGDQLLAVLGIWAEDTAGENGLLPLTTLLLLKPNVEEGNELPWVWAGNWPPNDPTKGQ